MNKPVPWDIWLLLFLFYFVLIGGALLILYMVYKSGEKLIDMENEYYNKKK